ncbi:MAG TPA: phage baseplate protein, partial [Blastocatellia bacterium]|nr:phage baseplate protein [Blastocatellia bacterium]
MRPLSASELLNAWEKSLSEPPSTRALALLSAACSDVAPQALARLSIGQRDARLLTLREWAFGAQLDSVANCPNCGEQLEWTLDAAELRTAPQAEPVGELSLDVDEYHVRFRLPDSLDVAAVADFKDLISARRALFERCILAASRNGQQITAAELPEFVREALVKQMSQADPQADTRLDLTCPACSHCWQPVFDIESFFWSEINAWARRLLQEVHTLANAYGWR